MKRNGIIRRLLAVLTAGSFICTVPEPVLAAEQAVSGEDCSGTDANLPRGWLLWHSYSRYDAKDSRLYLRDPEGKIQEIGGEFIHAMNGSFGSSPERITFMAIDSAADEWDIFLYDGGSVTNLTQNSGCRNEDPKWSPDGRQIVFKTGKWDASADDFVYQLALLNPESKTVTMLTDDSREEAMPCFSADGSFLYYTAYTDRIGAIMQMNLLTRETKTVFAEDGVNAYYPVVSGEKLYFTKWCSADNHCDQLMCYDGQTVTALPFNSERFDCSDACPVSSSEMIYSCTAEGVYDLYYYDGNCACRIPECSSGQNDLGASFFAERTGDVSADGAFDVADVRLLQKWMLAVSGTELNNWEAGDFYADGKLDAVDFSLMKRALLHS